ncbi:3-dehydroquinate synthase [Rubrimonas cliftonensis]|uniref:3-dehydroquinate synthase n=1 Tax=Rubrimonas cliftonensis TaxID=89524 RepID=A0A1H4BW14_9RHOB|nr:3-dehydroquinate synthase [Rubrimonas cliftonensis]SEA52032.1 3-dehydroquinate synthase [Rubrimonas cliftonensis]
MSDAGRETVRVGLGARAYDVLIGPGLIAEAGARLAPLARSGRVAVITDETVAALHGEALAAGLAAGGLRAETLALPPGEATKSMAMLERCLGWLLDLKLGREELVVAFGGGVIGDLAGFAAAVLKRGVAFAQIPTTLLAQVDSSVGGKTGINAPQGKNLIGAFHQPALVLADTAALGTLDPREFLAGYGEVAKYGLLGDADFFAWLEAHGPALKAGDMAALVAAVARCVAMKAEIVARDEFETGDRALLNLGHTFAHALETATGYSRRLLHGEAVAVGLGLAFEMSARLGMCPQEAPSRVAAHLAAMGTKARLADIPGPLPDADALLALMANDKKARDGRIAFVLADDIGRTRVVRDADPAMARAVLAEALAARD